MGEFAAVGMFAGDTGGGTFGELADVGVFHEATGEAETIEQIARSTYCRIGKMSWVAESFLGRDTLAGHASNVVPFLDKPNYIAKYISGREKVPVATDPALSNSGKRAGRPFYGETVTLSLGDYRMYGGRDAHNRRRKGCIPHIRKRRGVPPGIG